jgi:tetratricopeptide (TPR) repeat protein
MAEERPCAALELLQAAAGIAPWDRALFEMRLQCRQAAIAAAAARALRCENSGAWQEAAAQWIAALELDPYSATARAGVARVYRSEADDLTQEGDDLRAVGDLTGAMDRWERARRLRPDPALDDRLRQAEIERCLAAGVAHYEAGRGHEAAFQLRKVLALDPRNEHAARYLRYAESLLSDTLISDRFTRLE